MQAEPAIAGIFTERCKTVYSCIDVQTVFRQCSDDVLTGIVWIDGPLRRA
jgi:hypothetical protein